MEGVKCRRLTVIDLDGTLIRGNSLRVFMELGLWQMLRRGRLWRLVKAGVLVLLRVLGVVSHRRLKWGFCRLVDGDEEFYGAFVGRMRSMVREGIMGLAGEAEADGGRAVLLATAAFDVYVSRFWQGAYVATVFEGNKGRVECRGEEKLRRVSEYARRHGMVIDLVVSDHSDDLPLMMAARRVLLVSPSRGTVSAVRAAGVSFECVGD